MNQRLLSPGLPENYKVVDYQSTMSWIVLKIEDSYQLSLKNSLGKPKTFRSPKKAAAYAWKHADSGLSSRQEVPKKGK